MTDEEKQAIELLKIDCLVTSQQINDGELFMIEDEEKMRISSTQVLLNLIDKQQKEIEKLKSKKYILNAETNEIKEISISENYISKDKIKEKIRILEKLQKEFLNNNEIEIKIIAYKELLGE